MDRTARNHKANAKGPSTREIQARRTEISAGWSPRERHRRAEQAVVRMLDLWALVNESNPAPRRVPNPAHA